MPIAITISRPPAGAATAVLWFHGFLSDGGGDKATRVRERMNAEGRTFGTLDFRAHGKSPGRIEELTGTGLIEDAGRLVDRAAGDHTRIALVGSSMGAWTAARYAAAHPGAIAALVLIAPAFRFPGSLADAMGPEATARWERDGTAEFDAGFTRVPLGWALMEDAKRHTHADLVAAHATPTLIVHGMRDRSCDWRDSVRFLEEVRPGGHELRLLGDGDHRLTGYPERLAGWIHDFLASKGF